MKGFGTVVTGTLFSGSLSVEEPVEVLPSGLTGKVRGLHSHGRSLQTVYAGQRVAINLQGVDKEALKRGDVVVTPKKIVPTKVIDARIELLSDSPPLKSKSPVHLHMTTSETIARIIFYDHEELKPGDSCYCQLRLNEPVVAFSGDRFIVRRFSPVMTIGGGSVLDPSPTRRKRRDGIADLEIFEHGTLLEKIAMKVKKSGLRGTDSATIVGWIKAEIPAIEDSIKLLKTQATLVQLDSKLFHRAVYDALAIKIKGTLSDFHKKNPLSPGMQKEELRTHTKMSSEIWYSLVGSLNALVVDKDIVRLRDFSIASSDADASSQRVLQALIKAKFQPPSKEELAEAFSLSPKAISDILKLMCTEGKLVRINDSLHVPVFTYEELLSLLKTFFSAHTSMTVAEFRDILGTSRKYALPFLEYLDSHRITLRVGDVRKLLLKPG
jgi:selenocysteine-specific elongation factor